MKRIALCLRQGRKYATVDDEDYEELSVFNWFFVPSGYAVRRGPRPRRQNILMHRQIMGVEDENPWKVQVAHLNFRGLDNRRANLVVTTVSAIRASTPRKPVDASSGLRGVYLNRTSRRQVRWAARLMVRGAWHHLGSFATREEAGRAYDAAVLKYFGGADLARRALNFPDAAPTEQPFTSRRRAGTVP